MDKSAKIIVAVVVIIASSFFIYSKFAGWHANKLEATINQERMICQEKSDQLRQEIATLTQKLAMIKGLNIPEDKLAEVFGEEQEEGKQSGLQSEDKNLNEISSLDFAKIEGKIKAFFGYLDEQEYIQSFKYKEGIYRQYQITIGKLSSKLPIVTGEMSSLYNIVRNVAHFYRVLGKKRVVLIRQMLENESEVIESVMRTFYLWFTTDDHGQSTIQGRPSFKSMYEYAGYILNTLGGRSYLLRRNPNVRILTIYYCVLILDKANDEELNSRGIDIRPYIKSSLMDIDNQVGLAHQKEYLEKLKELKLKYPPY